MQPNRSLCPPAAPTVAIVAHVDGSGRYPTPTHDRYRVLALEATDAGVSLIVLGRDGRPRRVEDVADERGPSATWHAFEDDGRDHPKLIQRLHAEAAERFKAAALAG